MCTVTYNRSQPLHMAVWTSTKCRLLTRQDLKIWIIQENVFGGNVTPPFGRACRVSMTTRRRSVGIRVEDCRAWFPAPDSWDSKPLTRLVSDSESGLKVWICVEHLVWVDTSCGRVLRTCGRKPRFHYKPGRNEDCRFLFLSFYSHNSTFCISFTTLFLHE